jgi:hypothetical protein
VIQLILFLSLGAGFLVSLYLFARRGSRVEGSAQDVLKAWQALTALQSGLLPPEIAERIFSTDDYEYLIRGEACCLGELFLNERRRIALLWVAQVRQQILSLRHFHLKSARFYSALSVRTEMRLAFEFLTLLCVCRWLQIALYLGGPYAAPRMAGRAAAAAARVCEVSEKSMSFLKATPIDTLGGDSVNKLSLR